MSDKPETNRIPALNGIQKKRIRYCVNRMVQNIGSRQDSTKTVASFMEELELTPGEYDTVASLAMITVPYASISRNASLRIKAIKYEMRKAWKRAEESVKSGVPAETALANLIEVLKFTFNQFNHSMEIMTDEEAGVIDDDE